MGVDQQAHRSGALKQTNKAHKTGRHRSKGAIDNELKGVYGIFCKQCTIVHVMTQTYAIHLKMIVSFFRQIFHKGAASQA